MTYKLVWQDLFNQDHLDESIWNIETGGHGFGNKEDQYYTDQTKNLYIKDQTLHIVAHKETYQDKSYTSAKITTKEKKHIKYGSIYVMAHVPKGKGTWPAIWLLAEDVKNIGWPLAGEIDIMEHVGKDPGSFHFSLHTGAYNHRKNNHKTYVHKNTSLLDGFHLYRLDWDESSISYYVDNEHIVTFDKPDDHSIEAWPFDKPFYLIFNLAIGGTWGGEIDDSIFPVEFKIKYIKVYERSE